MLVLGAASNPWEMLSSLQSLQPANTSVPAAGIGQFFTDETTPAATSGSQSPAPPTGTIGQASLSPDVLGFLIWNQSQQAGNTQMPSGADTSAASGTNSSAGAIAGTADAASMTGTASSTPLQSLLSLLGSFGAGVYGSSGTGAAPGTNGGAPAGAAPPTQNATTVDGATPAADAGAAPASSGPHGGHHHHHGGFAIQSQSDPSDPLANLLGTSAPGASSTTATNGDGSTTTTITYADGSEVTLTTPPEASTATPGPSAAAAQPPVNSNNFLETLIQLQARLLAPGAAA